MVGEKRWEREDVVDMTMLDETKRSETNELNGFSEGRDWGMMR
jgi:hypothetical protein